MKKLYLWLLRHKTGISTLTNLATFVAVLITAYGLYQAKIFSESSNKVAIAQLDRLEKTTNSISDQVEATNRVAEMMVDQLQLQRDQAEFSRRIETRRLVYVYDSDDVQSLRSQILDFAKSDPTTEQEDKFQLLVKTAISPLEEVYREILDCLRYSSLCDWWRLVHYSPTGRDICSENNEISNAFLSIYKDVRWLDEDTALEKIQGSVFGRFACHCPYDWSGAGVDKNKYCREYIK